MKKVIIVSAVNLTQAGPLTVLQECLKYLSDNLADKYRVIALVNKKELFDLANIEYLEFPKSKKSWLNRLFYEYYYFRKISEQYRPDLWLSLHDMTPNVCAKRLAVYCHNASAFYKLSLKEASLDVRFTLFNLFYKYLYLINIKKNDFIVVQQSYLRSIFQEFAPQAKIIVAHPNISEGEESDCSVLKENIFFYPSFPRVFKNFEIIGKACEILTQQGVVDFQVIFTISGSENRYARLIYDSFKHIKQIKFIGIQQKENVYELYRRACCVIFPSKLETWGMPITEAKRLGKPLLLADLEYAHETLGSYDKAKFFDVQSPEQLAIAMKSVIDKTIPFEKHLAKPIKGPFTQNWKELFNILLHGV